MPDKTLKTVSATEIAAIMEVPTAYESRWMIYQRFRGAEIPPLIDNERLEWGRRLQGPILEAVADRYSLGIHQNAEDEYYQNEELKIGCTVDGWITDPSRGEGIVEAKNVDWMAWRAGWKFDQSDNCIAAPPHIELQVFHQMLAIDAKWGIIAALVGGNQLILLERERDEEIEAAILYAVEQFFEDVAVGKEPDVIGTAREIDVLKKLYPEVKYTPPLDLRDVEEGIELQELATDYKSSCDVRLTHDKRSKMLKAKILQLARENGTIELPNGTLRISQNGRRISLK